MALTRITGGKFAPKVNASIYFEAPYYVSNRTDHSLKCREYCARTGLYSISFFYESGGGLEQVAGKNFALAKRQITFVMLSPLQYRPKKSAAAHF